MNSSRDVWAQNPVSFNELLDLFEAYVSTIPEPLYSATEMIKDQLNYRSGDIFSHIMGVGNAASDMRKRIGHIRDRYNSSNAVQIALTKNDAVNLGYSLNEASQMLSDAGNVFAFLNKRISGDLDPESDEYFEALAVSTLARKALLDSSETQGSCLRRFAGKLEDASNRIDVEKEQQE